MFWPEKVHAAPPIVYSTHPFIFVFLCCYVFFLCVFAWFVFGTAPARPPPLHSVSVFWRASALFGAVFVAVGKAVLEIGGV